MNPEVLVDRFLMAWGEPDRAVLQERLAELCHPDLDYHNPVVALHGTTALADHIAGLSSLIGTRRLTRTTGVQAAGPWCRYGWALLPPVPGMSGETALHLEAERIRRVVSFHGPLPARTYAVETAR
jgi:hypothetical protein